MKNLKPLSNGFKTNEHDKCTYVKSTSNEYVIVYLYVDDTLSQKY